MKLSRLCTAKFFASRYSPLRVEKYLEQRRIKPSACLDYVMPNNIKLTAVQLVLDSNMTLIDLLDLFCNVMDKAQQDGSQLVCFPEYTGLLPLLCSKSLFEEFYHFSDDLINHHDEAVAELSAFYASQLAHPLFDCYDAIFSQLSARYRIYIQAGTAIVRTRTGLQNQGYLYDPAGKLVLTQAKLHLTDAEKRAGLFPGKQMSVAECSVGKVAMIIGRDQQVFEASKVAHQRGAQILLCPSGVSLSKGSSYFQSLGFMRSQEQQLFSVCSWLTGDFMDLPFRAISGIYAPLSASKLGNGIIAQTSNPVTDACITARVDLERLGKDANLYQSDINPCIDELLQFQYAHPRQTPVSLSPESDSEEDSEETAPSAGKI